MQCLTHYVQMQKNTYTQVETAKVFLVDKEVNVSKIIFYIAYTLYI